MRSLILVAVMLWPSLGLTKVLNVEFKFAPYTGDLKAQTVEQVAGTVRVFMNGVPFAEQPVEKKAVPVMFDDREIGAAIWIPTESMGAALRKSKNTIRIEFDPADPKAVYRTQLRWASVTDNVHEKNENGKQQATNQEAQGSEDKEATGKVVVERTFDADFAIDKPWHHYPPVTAVSDEDKQQLMAMLKTRAEGFKPDFAAVYAELGKDKKLKIDEIKKMKCLDAAYKAGLRIAPPAAEDLVISATGIPEVVITRKGGNGALFTLDTAPFGKITDEEVQMCAGITIMRAFPPKLVVVRAPDGKWSTPY